MPGTRAQLANHCSIELFMVSGQAISVSVATCTNTMRSDFICATARLAGSWISSRSNFPSDSNCPTRAGLLGDFHQERHTGFHVGTLPLVKRCALAGTNQCFRHAQGKIRWHRRSFHNGCGTGFCGRFGGGRRLRSAFIVNARGFHEQKFPLAFDGAFGRRLEMAAIETSRRPATVIFERPLRRSSRPRRRG